MAMPWDMRQADDGACICTSSQYLEPISIAAGCGKTSLAHLIAHGTALRSARPTVGCNTFVTTLGALEDAAGLSSSSQRQTFVELWDIGASHSVCAGSTTVVALLGHEHPGSFYESVLMKGCLIYEGLQGYDVEGRHLTMVWVLMLCHLQGRTSGTKRCAAASTWMWGASS